MKTLFTILLCLSTVMAFGGIQERIQKRMLEKTLNDTEIQQMVEEEIQKSVVVIPIVKIPVITIDMITLDVIETILVGMDSEQIEALTIKIYDISSQARNLREEINISVGNVKFKKYLKNKNWAMCSNVLLKAGVDKKVVDVLIASIGKVPKPVDIPFFECKMAHTQTYKGEADENVFVVGTYQEEVCQGDVVVFDVTSRSNLIKGVKFVEKNKDKIGAVIIGWGSNRMNNYDNLDITTYPKVMKWYSDFYSICKGIKPDIPVGVIVSMSITWEEWLNSCKFKFDFVALWNITKFTANFAKIKNTYFRNEEVMICGVNATDVDLNQRYNSGQYRSYIKELKRLDYCGSIYIKTKGGE